MSLDHDNEHLVGPVQGEPPPRKSRKACTCCAGVLALAVVAVGLFLAAAFFLLGPAHESAGKFIDGEVIPALKEMDREKLKALGTPDMQNSMETTETIRMFQVFEERLGKLTHFNSIKAQTHVNMKFSGNSTYQYSIPVTFEKSTGTLSLVLQGRDDVWKLQALNIRSPALIS